MPSARDLAGLECAPTFKSQFCILPFTGAAFGYAFSVGGTADLRRGGL